jgi:hypothetical protein
VAKPHETAMTAWRFAGDVSDGEIWLRFPLHAHIYVDYVSPRTANWRRIGVATRAFVTNTLQNVRDDNSRPLCAVLPTLLVVPDADGDALQASVSCARRLAVERPSGHTAVISSAAGQRSLTAKPSPPSRFGRIQRSRQPTSIFRTR